MTRVALVPVGAVEAHGPHLPLDTDTRIATLLAERVAGEIRARGGSVVVAAPFTRTAASFAASFPGTEHVPGEVERRLLADHVVRVVRGGVDRVVLLNLHFDPEHMAAVRDLVERWPYEQRPGTVLFPNFTRRAHAQAIGGEFATGACHGGEFETSLMLVAAPHLVKPAHRTLPMVHVDLAKAIRDGKRSFRDVGMDRAYCGHPATASAAEGERVLAILARIVMDEMSAHP